MDDMPKSNAEVTESLERLSGEMNKELPPETGEFRVGDIYYINGYYMRVKNATHKEVRFKLVNKNNLKPADMLQIERMQHGE